MFVEQIIGTMLSQIDPMVIKVFLIMIVACLVLALIKKAVKIIITVVLIGCLVAGLGYFSEQYQDRYKIGINDGIIYLTLDGKDFELGDGVKDMVLERQSNGSYNLTATYDDGIQEINIPAFMKPIIEGYDKIFEADIKIVD